MNAFMKTLIASFLVMTFTTACAWPNEDVFEKNEEKIMSYIKDHTIYIINTRSSYYSVLNPTDDPSLKLKRKWCKEFMGRNVCRFEVTFNYTRTHYRDWDAGDGDFYHKGTLEKTRRNVFYFFADNGDGKTQFIHQFFSGDAPLSYLAQSPKTKAHTDQLENNRQWSEDYWGDEVNSTRPKLERGIRDMKGIIITSN